MDMKIDPTMYPIIPQTKQGKYGEETASLGAGHLVRAK